MSILARRALRPFEERAERAGTVVAAELDAEEQRALLDDDAYRRRGE